DAIRDVLTSGGPTLAQGALGWLLARSPRAIPIPGIRTVAQAGQNAPALHLGALPAAQLAAIAPLLAPRAPPPAPSPRTAVPRPLTVSTPQVPCWGAMSGIFPPSQAAEQSGFSLDPLRYYERIGLLDGIARAPSGHRRFHDDDLEWLGVLRCLRDTGMPIAQMRRYAELARGGQATLAERLNLLTQHDARVPERIALLPAQHRHLPDEIHL